MYGFPGMSHEQTTLHYVAKMEETGSASRKCWERIGVRAGFRQGDLTDRQTDTLGERPRRRWKVNCTTNAQEIKWDEVDSIYPA